MNVTRRANISISLVLAAFMLLIARLAQLQVFAADEYRAAGENQHTRVTTMREPRGEIRDTTGFLLAFSEPGFELRAEPARVEDPEAVTEQIAKITGDNASDLLSRFWQARERVLVKRGLSIEDAREIRALKIKGVRLDETTRRVYPLGPALVHVLGVVGVDGNGLEGLEYSWNHALASRDGKRVTRSDALRKKIDLGTGREYPSLPGSDLILTIDAAIQRTLYEEMAREAERISPIGGAGVVLDPYTGDVKALVSWPSYLPEERGTAPGSASKNRVILDAYEPGSTFKPIVFAWAMDKGLLNPGEKIFAENGKWRVMRSRTLHDTHPEGLITIEKASIVSSNIVAAKIGRRLGADRLYQCLVALGFTERTGVGFPGEAAGIVRPRTVWSPHTVISVPFGQELAVTPLQLATGYAAVINGGLKIRPRLIEALVDEDGNTLRDDFSVETPKRVLSESTSAWVRRTLERVVEEGTGRRARVPGLRVGGKTGTSQKYERDPMTGKMRVSKTKVVASFVGFAPADRPKLLAVVMWDEPQKSRYGGSSAAPVVQRLFARTLGETGTQGDL